MRNYFKKVFFSAYASKISLTLLRKYNFRININCIYLEWFHSKIFFFFVFRLTQSYAYLSFIFFLYVINKNDFYGVLNFFLKNYVCLT